MPETNGLPASYMLDGLTVGRLVAPADPAELATALAQAGAAGEAVVPVGGGTQLGLGNRPRAADLALSTRRLDRVLEHEPANLTVSVQAGLTLGALQAALAEHGQLLPVDPPDAARATVGGLLATNATGPRRLGAGSWRDLLIGALVATPAGRLVRSGGKVVKNVAGYDLNKLYVGSLGTLGVLVELTFKVAPHPADEATLLAAFADPAAACAAARALVRSPLQPAALELLGAATAAEVGLAGLAPAGGWTLAVLAAGVPPAVRRQVSDVGALARDGGATSLAELDAAASARLWSAVAELGRSSDGASLRARVAVPLTATPAALRALAAAGARLGTPPALWSHAGSGIVYARWPAEVAAGDWAELAAAALGAARASAADGQGSLVLEEAPLALKRRLDVWGYAGDALPAMRALKAQLDPRGTLNPGRFVGGI